MPKVSDAGGTPAIVPLSLLEALRNLDTPVGDGLDEVAGEIVSKRFGLSATVAAQIQRYQDAHRRGLSVPAEETVGVFRLVGRRPDAALVYADAGRRAARYAAREISLPARALMTATPGFIRRRLGASVATRAARRTFGAALAVRGRSAEAVISHPLSLRALPDGEACSFYGAALAEMLRVLTGFEGAMVHMGCRGRGDDTCRWQAAAAEGYS
jgi:predicted hydrocarbon binding protein